MIRTLLSLALPALAIVGTPASARVLQDTAVTAETRYIDSEKLSAEAPKGIPEYTAKLKALVREFEPLQTDLRARFEAIRGIETRHAAALKAGDMASASKLYDAHKAATRELGFRKEDAEGLYRKRSREVLAPLIDRVTVAAKRFAETRRFADLQFANGDAARFQQAGAREVTADFVAWYAVNAAQ